MVKVIPLGPTEAAGLGRLGFMAGDISVPDDFDPMGGDELVAAHGNEILRL